MPSRDQKDLHPALQECWQELKRLAKQELNLDILLTCTYRTNAEQTVLYNQGRTTKGKIVTNAKAGQSAHNVVPPQGAHAFDFAVRDRRGNITWSDETKYIAVAAIARRLGADAGAFWLNFRDNPHIQMPNWRIGKTYAADFRFVKPTNPQPIDALQPKKAEAKMLKPTKIT
jgi:peptidoglycan LD-endopeptidase CwlK